MMKQYVLIALLLASALLLSACTPKQAAPQPTAAATLAPTEAAATEATQADVPAAGTQAPAQGQYNKITAEQAKARMDSGDELLIVDVRTPEEYAAGHIKGALLLPLDTIGQSTLEVIEDKHTELLLYCRSGNRSRTAAMQLLELGYTNVHDFGGVNTWPYGLVTE